MFLIMVSSQAYKGSLCQWIFVGAVQEWKENDIVVLRLDRSYPLIGDIVYGASVFFRFCFFIRLRMNHSIFPADVGLLSSIR